MGKAITEKELIKALGLDDIEKAKKKIELATRDDIINEKLSPEKMKDFINGVFAEAERIAPGQLAKASPMVRLIHLANESYIAGITASYAAIMQTLSSTIHSLFS